MSKQVCFIGEASVGAGKKVYINSQTGEGMDKIMPLIKKFVYFHARKLSFPSYTHEDVMQELYRIAIEAIPAYNPDKNANLMTFLQSHVKNRAINLCKFYSEKRRNASFVKPNSIKLRCNTCRTFFSQRSTAVMARCPCCGVSGESGAGGAFKSYNMPIVPLSYNNCVVSDGSDDNNDSAPGVNFSAESDNSPFGTMSSHFSENFAMFKIDLANIIAIESEINKSIIELILQGYTKKEIIQHHSQQGLSVEAAFDSVINRLKSSLEAYSGNEQGRSEHVV